MLLFPHSKYLVTRNRVCVFHGKRSSIVLVLERIVELLVYVVLGYWIGLQKKAGLLIVRDCRTKVFSFFHTPFMMHSISATFIQSPDRIIGLQDPLKGSSRIPSFFLLDAINYSYITDIRFVLFLCLILGFGGALCPIYFFLIIRSVVR